jgi:hypothetical protein
MVPYHGYYELRGRMEVLGGVLVAATRAELHDTLDTNVQGFQLLMDEILRHSSVLILDR